MTEQYKETLLNYLIGQLPNDSGQDNPILFDTNEQVNSLKTKIEEELGTSNYYVIGLCNTDTTDKFIIYGYYEVNYGFVAILDDNIQVIKVLTTYDSGAKFRKFSCLNFDEEGNLYGIDEYIEFNITTYRFIMLNNILNSSTNSYNVILRQSYILDSTYSNFEFSNNSIKKVPNEATYFIVGNYIDANTTQYDIALLVLKVNVGSENEWNLYKAGKQNSYKQSFDFIIEKQGNESTAYIVFGVETKYTGVYECYFDGSNVSTVLLSLDEDISNFKVISKEKFYFSGGYIDSSTDKFVTYIKEYINGSVKEITNISHEKINNEVYSLELNNNNLLWYVIDYQNSEYLFKIGIYDGESYAETVVCKTLDIAAFPVLFFFSKNIYNLYKIFIQIEDEFYITSTVLNTGYNGEKYINKNSLIPNNVILNSENNTIFARNLYNKSINSNSTIATVEIPNTYLNDARIHNKKLMSKTNLLIVDDTNVINKNIFETVYLNFINSLLIKDKNNVNDIKKNLNASTYLNQKINLEDGYDNAKMIKARINYTDNTNKIISFSPKREIKSISGASLDIDDGKSESIKSLTIEGKSVQDGIPTPNVSIEIKNVQGVINLFDGNISNGGYDPTTGVITENTYLNRNTNPIFVKPNTNYIISNNGKGIIINILEYKSDGTFIKNNNTGAGSYITTSSETAYINFYRGTADTDKIQVEEGTIIHSYVPFGSWLQINISNNEQDQSTLIDMNNYDENGNIISYYEMASITNKDILTIQNKQATINKKISKIILDGTENWSYVSGIGFYCDDNLTLNAKIPGRYEMPSILCSHFKPETYQNSWNTITDNTICISYDNSSNPRIICSQFTTIDEFKEFLKNQYNAGKPVTIEYELAEPQIITLNGIYDLKLFDGINNITTNDELEPTIIIEYYTNAILRILELLIYVGKKINNIEFISNDEITVYHTVDLSNLDIGKYYKINQRLEVI